MFRRVSHYAPKELGWRGVIAMNLNPFRDWRTKVFRLLRAIAPEGSSLDAVFGSYDDYRAHRTKRGKDSNSARSAPRPEVRDSSDTPNASR
jgi:hypothetical protein